MKIRLIIAAALLVSLPFFARLSTARAEGEASQTSPGNTTEQGDAGVASAKNPTTQVVTEHVLTLPDGAVAYTATAGELLVEPSGPSEPTAKGGKPKARIFSVSYVKSGEDPARRPVTFAFNGGPGAASVWLHLGALGPRRVELAPDGRPLPPPARLTDNLESWLPFTDIVFVDPVGTGYSRAVDADGKEADAFFGVKQDLATVAEFVRLWLTRNQRWLSPCFLVGESYGATRAAALAGHLFQTYGMAVNGVTLISPVLSFDTILFTGGNDLPYPLYLPTYAATALHHGKTQAPRGLGKLLDEAERFAYSEYLPALALGDALAAEERLRIRSRLVELTGLDPKLLERGRERVKPETFFKELLRDRALLVGRMDGSVTGHDPDPAAPYPDFDPSLDPLFGPFSSGINAYLRGELKFESDLVYEFLSLAVNRSWDWTSGLPQKQGFVDVADSLAGAMAVNPSLKVMLACGIYDMATPFAAAEYTVRHMGLAPELRGNVRIERYAAGHMMFTHGSERAKLAADARAFYEFALGDGAQGEGKHGE